MAVNCYITFPTIFFAIRAENLLKKKGFSFKMVPVPRAISSSCGTALRCACPDLPEIRKHLAENGTAMESFYRFAEDGLKIPGVEELKPDDLR